MKEIMTEWKNFLNESNLVSTAAKGLNEAYIATECTKVFEKYGMTAEVINILTKNIIKGLNDASANMADKGIGIENTANLVSNLVDGLIRLCNLCVKFKINPGGYLTKFLSLTAEGTLTAAALSFLSLILASKSIGDFLADTGREFEKSKGSFSLKDLRELENRIKQEGLESVRASEANTSIKKGVIAKYFADAKKFYPNVVQMFPTVFQLLDRGWQKGLL